MKNILSILIAFYTITSEAQNPEINKYDNPNYKINNAYYKDVNNIHEQYVGTWLYTNGNITFKIIFKVRTMVYVNGHLNNYYSDYLVGEYQYIENGVERVNTLANINTDFQDTWDYNLCSTNYIRNDVYPKCSECLVTEKRLNMQFNEPSRRHISGFENVFALRKFTENGVEKLKVWFARRDNGVYFTLDHQPTDIIGFSLPYGEYVLIKQD